MLRVPEFAESLQEMGTCLLEKTALNDDEENGEWVNISWIPYPSYLASLLVDLNYVYTM